MAALLALCALLAAPSGARAQSLESLRLGASAIFLGAPPAPPAEEAPAPGPAKPARKPDAPTTGPEAVLELERSFRGPKNKDYKGCCHGDKPHAPVRRRREEEAYPQAKPIPLAGLKNITPMTRELWTQKQLEADFAKSKGKDQQAILVMVKTEACHLNEHRICAAATAALEKLSTPALSKFRVYAAWIRGNPDQQGRDWQRWEDDVAATYRFEQGPGAKLIVIVPGVSRPFEASASSLGLGVDELEKNKGATPKLEAFLNEALETGQRLRR